MPVERCRSLTVLVVSSIVMFLEIEYRGPSMPASVTTTVMLKVGATGAPAGYWNALADTFAT